MGNSAMIKWSGLAWGLALLTLSACAPPAPPSPSVSMTSPPDTAVIYASALYAAGTARNVSAFTLRLTTAAGITLTETQVRPAADGVWSVELVHGHTGDPVAATLAALPVSPAAEGEAGPLARAEVLLAGVEHRPEGAYVDLMTPVDGAEVGGDSLIVEGRVSGWLGGSFTVALVSSFDETLDTRVVEIPDPHVINDLPWAVALSPGEYTGSAVIVVTFADGTRESVAVVVSAAAG